MTTGTLSLFEGYGIEIESTVVDAETLEVLPVVDELLRRASGEDAWIEDFEDGEIGWSNELVAHVVELKTNGPVPSYAGVAERFRASAGRMSALLREHCGARLMPTAMHPWMDPRRETRLWPHDSGPVYRAYDELFDCRRHGWANVQSVHLNLPFANEDEFGRLMAAVRLVLPMIPALAASSPVVEGRATGLLDNRLEYYRTNSQRVRAMAADVIPEPVFEYGPYEEQVLGGLYRELIEAGADPALHGNEWTNARGAIARFDRMAIEIRLIDAQECATADLAVAAAVSGLVRSLVEERTASFSSQKSWSTESLLALLFDPARPRERAFATNWLEALRARRPELRLMRNRPYRGNADGLTTTLRGVFPARDYLGLELEVSQRFPRGAPARWLALRRDVRAALAAALRPERVAGWSS